MNTVFTKSVKGRSQKDFFDVGTDIYEDVVDKYDVPEVTDKFITIYEVFDILYKLFNDLNALNKEDPVLNKITLLEQYPDEEFIDGSVTVIYKVGEKRYLQHKSEGGSRDYVQVKPFELKSGYDLVTNNIVHNYANKFMTTISLEVIAYSNRDLMRVVEYIEAVLLKHRAQLKCFIQDYIYVGQTPTEFSQGYQNKRLFSRSLVYKIVTYETYSLVSEELKYIK